MNSMIVRSIIAVVAEQVNGILRLTVPIHGGPALEVYLETDASSSAWSVGGMIVSASEFLKKAMVESPLEISGELELRGIFGGKNRYYLRPEIVRLR